MKTNGSGVVPLSTELVVGGAGTAAFAVDMTGRVLTWNAGAAKLFSLPARRAIGMQCSMAVRGCTPDGIPLCTSKCVIREQAVKGKPFPVSVDMTVREGLPPSKRLDVRMQHIAVRDGQGKPAAILHFATRRR